MAKRLCEETAFFFEFGVVAFFSEFCLRGERGRRGDGLPPDLGKSAASICFQNRRYACGFSSVEDTTSPRNRKGT